MRIITHTGTGTATVKAVCQVLGHSLVVVDDLKTFRTTAFDAAIILGGRDIAPMWYGQKNTYSDNPDKDRDTVEWAIIRTAMQGKKPLLGICRGMQMIAVAHGGSLYQDMVKDGATTFHTANASHKISINGPLALHVPEVETVNSLHHQSIRDIPATFKVLARSDDGIIEAIWKTGVLGVQWHPELLFPYDSRWIALFKWFTNGLR